MLCYISHFVIQYQLLLLHSLEISCRPSLEIPMQVGNSDVMNENSKVMIGNSSAVNGNSNAAR